MITCEANKCIERLALHAAKDEISHGPSQGRPFNANVYRTSLGVTSAGTDDGAKYYVLRSYLPSAVRKDFLQRRAPDAVPTQAFELTVLALIVMNGDRISDGVVAGCGARHNAHGCFASMH